MSRDVRSYHETPPARPTSRHVDARSDASPGRRLDCPTCALSSAELLECRPGCAACLVRARRARAWLADWTGAPLWD